MTISINITGETVEVVQRKLRDMAAALGGAVTITGGAGGTNHGTSVSAAAPAAKAADKAEAKKSEKTAAPAPAAASSQTPATEPESAPTSESEAVVEYKTVGDAINAAAKINKQAVIDLLAKFGAKRGTDLKPEQYSDVLAALKDVA